MGKNMNQRSDTHLDLLRIDAVRAGEGSAKETAHCEICSECRQALEQFERFEATLKNMAEFPIAKEIEETDLIIMQEFKRSFQNEERTKVIQFPIWKRWLVPAASFAVAAGLVLAVSLSRFQHRSRVSGIEKTRMTAKTSLVEAEAPEGDFNEDGRFDILDAFQMSLLIEKGGTPNKAWDINSDGIIDESDADELAQMAVSLAGG